MRKAFDATRFMVLTAVFMASAAFFSMESRAEDIKTYTIGVLADRGKPACLNRWENTAKYLTDNIAGTKFEILPMEYGEEAPFIKSGRVDFVISNPSTYVEEELAFGIQRIATLKEIVGDRAYAVSGGVMFALASRDDINSLKDVKGKKLSAVNDKAFRGWIAPLREMKNKGIDPYRDAKGLTFRKTADDVVYSVLDGTDDIGVVSTGILEKMAREGKVDIEVFKVLKCETKCRGEDLKKYPFLKSTRLYPTWPFAKTEKIADDLAAEVSIVLMNMAPDDLAAVSGGYAGWTVPAAYTSVHECLRELRMGPYKDYGKITPMGVLKEYWPWILAILVLMLFMVITIVSVGALNFKLEHSESRLKEEISEKERINEELGELNEELLREEKALQDTVDQLNKSHEDLVNTQNQLIQAEKLASIGLLAAGVAHEINNPIAFLGSNLVTLGKYIGNMKELIEALESLKNAVNKDDKEEIEKQLERIFKMEETLDIEYILSDISSLLKESWDGTERIRKIVSDLGTFSRKDDGLTSKANVNEILDGIINIVWSEIKYKTEVRKDFGKVPLIECNARQLGQVFINMFVNAAQAIKQRGVIGVKTYYKEDTVFVEISDTGEGIPPENIAKIFDPFFTTKEVGKGTGLGLSICYEIMKKHGGNISVKSHLGEGTTFTISIPVVNNGEPI